MLHWLLKIPHPNTHKLTCPIFNLFMSFLLPNNNFPFHDVSIRHQRRHFKSHKITYFMFSQGFQFLISLHFTTLDPVLGFSFGFFISLCVLLEYGIVLSLMTMWHVPGANRVQYHLCDSSWNNEILIFSPFFTIYPMYK